MPIDIDDFEEADVDFLRSKGSPDREKVLEYLAFNPEKAYSREEIQSATGIKGIDLIATLSRLENEGVVRHKGQYWAIDPGYDPSELGATGETP